MPRKKIKAADPTKAITYIRVSTAEQVKSGLGLEAQATAVNAYCTMRGFEVVAELRDEGVSAATPLGNRPAGAELLELVRARKAGSVVIPRLDRAFRNAADCLATVGELDRLGVALHLVDFGGSAVDTKSPAGKMFITVLAGVAQFERDIIAERIRLALAEKKRRGERVGSIPYGKKLAPDGRTLVEEESESVVIDLIYNWNSRGISVPQIVKKLNQDRIENRKGKKWYPTQVYRILAR